MKILKFVTFSILLLISTEVFSQLSVSSYSIYALGVSTSHTKKVSGELKLFGNRMFDEILYEPAVLFNFSGKEYHQFSIGVGCNFTPFGSFDRINALTVPFQLQIFPLAEMKKISLLIELTPEFIPEESMNLRHLWGIRYTFGN